MPDDITVLEIIQGNQVSLYIFLAFAIGFLILAFATKNISAYIKITPVFVLVFFMVVLEIDILIAATVAVIYGVFVAMYVMKASFASVVDEAIAKTTTANEIILILMMAYAIGEVFMASGVGAAVIRVAISSGITGKSVAGISFITTCVLSIATGTAWGTFATCAPIFIWLSHIAGGDPLFTAACISGGSCFGDCIGLINDTTILSSKLQEVEIIDRIRHQGFWSIGTMLISAIIIFFISFAILDLPNDSRKADEAIQAIPQSAMEALAEKRPAAIFLLDQVESGVPVYMLIPPILVLFLAFSGFETFICLGAGILTSLLLGTFAGTVVGAHMWVNLVYSGFEDAGSWVIIMLLWITLFGGLMSMTDAFAPIANGIVKIARNVRQLMFCNALLCLFGNAILSDEMAQIVTISPIIKQITDENVIASDEDMYVLRLRNSAFADALGVFGSQLIPWHVYMIFFVDILNNVYPQEILATLVPSMTNGFTAAALISRNVLAIVAVGSMLLLTLTGFDRFVPKFSIPSEPQVYLKSQRAKFEKKVSKKA